jgi:hypothetical protein
MHTLQNVLWHVWGRKSRRRLWRQCLLQRTIGVYMYTVVIFATFYGRTTMNKTVRSPPFHLQPWIPAKQHVPPCCEISVAMYLHLLIADLAAHPKLKIEAIFLFNHLPRILIKLKQKFLFDSIIMWQNLTCKPLQCHLFCMLWSQLCLLRHMLQLLLNWVKRTGDCINVTAFWFGQLEWTSIWAVIFACPRMEWL